jgi:hypothetical protein
MRYAQADSRGDRRANSPEGATAVEYALMVALIALVIFGAVVALGIATSDAMCGPVPALGDGAGDC